ncbi:hypothetical protein ACPA9J_34985 [Pseudomonas aeruginosa]
MPGVREVSVNLASERAHLELLGAVDSQALLQAVEQAGLQGLACSTRGNHARTMLSAACAANAGRLSPRCCWRALPLVLLMLVEWPACA